MIFDDLVNLKQYNIVSDEVLDFISKLNINTPVGRYDITDRIYANVEEYNTKSELDANLEGHRKYIDIQLLISGQERIDFINIDGLKVLESYDCVKDIIFYKKPRVELNKLYLNGRNFAIFYHQNAHTPGITTLGLQKKKKKVVIKIAVDYL